MVSAEALDVVVRLELIEIPTLLEAQHSDADGNGTFDDAEVADLTIDTCDDVLGEVAIDLDGSTLAPARPTGVSARLDAGEAGLDMLLVTCRGRVDVVDGLSETALDFDVASTIGADWLGRRDLVVVVPASRCPTRKRPRPCCAPRAGDAQQVLPSWAVADAGNAQEIERVVDRDLDGPGFLEDITGRFTDLVSTSATPPNRSRSRRAARTARQLRHARGRARAAARRHGQALGIASVVATTRTVGVLALGLLLTVGKAIVTEEHYP